MINVGIIDSGLPLQHGPTVSNQKDFTSSSSTVDQLGHGSMVSNIIASASHVTLASARVFDRRLVCTPKQVADAIHWLIDQQVVLINMSFGLRQDRQILREACERAAAENILIVAATPAQGMPVYPSNYEGVIRATGDARCRSEEISWLDSQQADFGGYTGDPLKGAAGASIGCASVSAACCKFLAEYSSDVYLSLTKYAHFQGAERRVN